VVGEAEAVTRGEVQALREREQAKAERRMAYRASAIRRGDDRDEMSRRVWTGRDDRKPVTKYMRERGED
jgi:hypothetical protein